MHKVCHQLLGSGMEWPAMADAWVPNFPLLAELRTTAQDSIWHGEGDVFVHTGLVVEEARKLIQVPGRFTDEEALILLLAAVFHDIGKPLTSRARDIGGSTRIVAPRHADAGRNYLCLRMASLQLPEEVEEKILALVALHHEPRRLVQDEAPPAKWRQLARQCPPALLYWLEQADLRGRICPDLDEQLETMELFRLRCEELKIWQDPDPWSDWREAIDQTFVTRSPEFRKHAFQAAVFDAEAGLIQSVEEGVARAWQLREPVTDLILLWGPSGSGKSTWIARYAPEAQVISLDKIRQALTGKRANQSKNGQVIQAGKEQLKRLLRQPGQVIWDATNLRRDLRAPLLELGRNYGARVTIVALKTTPSALEKNNRKRQHPVPGSVLARQVETLEWPGVDEAHELVTIRQEVRN